MIVAFCILFVFTMLLGVALYFSVQKNFVSDDRIDDLLEENELREKQIDDSLEIIDDCYAKIAKAANSPLMSDEPEIKELMLNLRRTKDAVLLVANKLNTLGKEQDEKEEIGVTEV